MRFLVAAVVMTMASSPALASEMVASSRAIPPMESEESGYLADDHPAPAAEIIAASQFAFQNANPSNLVLKRTDESLVKPPLLRVEPKQEDVVRPPLLRPADSDRERQQTCIAQAVYYESKGEPVRGQRAVADVIINRTKRRGFASTPCGVIRQPHQFTNAHRWKIPSSGDPLWKRAKEIAQNAMEGVGRVSEVITHFHASRINPGWKMRRVAAIGAHIFY